MNKRLLAAVEIGKLPLGGSSDNTIDKYTSISPLISSLLTNAIVIAGIILVGLILFGGFGMISSAGSGDTKKAEQSKKTITSAIIGFIVVFCAYLIIQIIETITGMEILNPSFLQNT